MVALGAVCELRADYSTGFGSRRSGGDGRGRGPVLSFSLVEFSEISDGRRLTLRSDRGWGSSRPRVACVLADTDERGPGPPTVPFDLSDPWQFETRQTLTESVLACVGPDDDEQWYEWVVARLGELDVVVGAASVRAAPYRVEFGPLLDSKLRKRAR